MQWLHLLFDFYPKVLFISQIKLFTLSIRLVLFLINWVFYRLNIISVFRQSPIGQGVSNSTFGSIQYEEQNIDDFGLDYEKG